MSERQYGTWHLPNLEVPDIFKHTPPDSKPTAPSTAGLDAYEIIEVNRWLDGLVAPTLTDAITYKNDYTAYLAALDAWEFADHEARVTQYRIAHADAVIYNKATTSRSATDTGTGDSPPGPAVYPRSDP